MLLQWCLIEWVRSTQNNQVQIHMYQQRNQTLKVTVGVPNKKNLQESLQRLVRWRDNISLLEPHKIKVRRFECNTRVAKSPILKFRLGQAKGDSDKDVKQTTNHRLISWHLATLYFPLDLSEVALNTNDRNNAIFLQNIDDFGLCELES